MNKTYNKSALEAEGYDAFYLYKDLEDNPYEEGTSLWSSWREGWLRAAEEDDDTL